MKPSKYNYYVPSEGSTIFFNGITEKFFHVSDKNTDSFREIIESPDEYAETYGSFIDRMKASGFIVDDNTDEHESLLSKYKALRQEDQYYLMILPTYQCNLRCWYCTQEHSSTWMSEDTVERLCKHVVLALQNPEIKRFHLSWFGGEPVMAYELVKAFTEYTRDRCREKGVAFTCHITTNSTLLNKQRIAGLTEAGVSSYQITIDGDRKTHDSIKQLGNGSAFDKALENIEEITRQGGFVSLRFNYSAENLKPDEIIRDLSPRLSKDAIKNMRFSLHKVWQEDSDKISEEKVDSLSAQAEAMGILTRYAVTGMCYADQKHFTCVFPNGNIGKCDNNGIEDCDAHLDADGGINWYGETDYLTPVVEAGDSECSECRYLPICFGPCTARRQEFKGIKCYWNDREKDMRANILSLCNNRKAIESFGS